MVPPTSFHTTFIHLWTTDQPTIHLCHFLLSVLFWASHAHPVWGICPPFEVPSSSLVVRSYHFWYGALPPTCWPIGHPSKPLVWHPTLPALGPTVFLIQYPDFIFYSLFFFNQFIQCY